MTRQRDQERTLGVQSCCYKILGIPAGSTQSEIYRAYKDRAVECHPDKWSTSSAEASATAEERFRVLTRTVEVLGDPADVHMSVERAHRVFAHVVIQYASASLASAPDRTTAILKLVSGLGLPPMGFYFGAAPVAFAGQALCLLLNDPTGFPALWDDFSAEERREFSAAVFVLARSV